MINFKVNDLNFLFLNFIEFASNVNKQKIEVSERSFSGILKRVVYAQLRFYQYQYHAESTFILRYVKNLAHLYIFWCENSLIELTQNGVTLAFVVWIQSDAKYFSGLKFWSQQQQQQQQMAILVWISAPFFLKIMCPRRFSTFI